MEGIEALDMFALLIDLSLLSFNPLLIVLELELQGLINPSLTSWSHYCSFGAIVICRVLSDLHYEDFQ